MSHTLPLLELSISRQPQGRSLDTSMNSCAIIEVGLQNHK